MMRSRMSCAEVVVGVAILVSIQGCWMSAGRTGPLYGWDGGTDTDSDVDSDTDTDTDACEEQNLLIYNDPARVLILQDHSSSMAEENWDIARSAIYALLTTFTYTSLEFGLDTVPDPNGDCQVDAPIIVDCGPDTESAIHGALAGMSTIVSTPLYEALHNFLDPDYAPGCTESEYAEYILLVADGEDSCSSVTAGDFAELTQELVLSGIKVIVVGFNVVWDAEQLNAIAANGGTAFTTYLDADDEPSLDAALAAIAVSIDSCFFFIDSAAASAHPELVNCYFDGALLYMDEDCSSGSGWRWADEEHTQIEFCPDSCALLGAGEVDEITATYGCDTVVE